MLILLLFFFTHNSRNVVDGECEGSISEVEYDALQHFFQSTNGLYWTFGLVEERTKWRFPSPLSEPCSVPWQGLNCTWGDPSQTQCFIVSVELQNANITGKLSPFLANLTYLNTLALPNNTLTGQMPSEYGMLTNLQYLYFPYNLLSGSVPSEYGTISTLFFFAIYHNKVGGSIPTELGMLTNLNLIAFQENRLVGSIPSELGALTQLETLYLYANCLTSSAPSELGSLVMVGEFSLEENYLSGQIPTTFGGLISCYTFNMNSNLLDGPIPFQLGQLTLMDGVGLASNMLTSSIPSQLGDQLQLSSLTLNSNFITDMIPAELNQCIILQNLQLYDNFLSGTLIGSLLENMKIMFVFNLAGNLLSGTLPSEVGNLINVVEFFVTDNSLFGSLPTEVGKMGKCLFFYVNDNLLEGSIVTELGQMSNLRQLSAGGNRLTGTIPLEISMAIDVQMVGLSSNLLSGPVPAVLARLADLQVLQLNSNLLTGTVPSELSGMAHVVQLLFSFNYLSQQLPDDLANCSDLAQFNADSNYLSGSVPNTYNLLWQLESLNVSNNLLSGSFLTSLFLLESDTDIQTAGPSMIPFAKLTLVDMSMNRLSGSLPDSMFTRPNASLQVLILFENCFSGTLPESMCSSSELSVLVLDALSSAENCRVQVASALQPFVAAEFSNGQFYGSIPACLWALSNLQVLHLSSNGLTGSIAEVASPDLAYISLSNNNFIGSIPSSIQQFQYFSQLDLSNNRFSGTLDKQYFQVNESSEIIDLTVNRLSGQIPGDVYLTKHLNILDGNLFQCQTDHMPSSDPNRKSDDCGSNNFNNAAIVWGVMLVVVCLTALLLPSKLVHDAFKFDQYLKFQQDAWAVWGESLSQSVKFFLLLKKLSTSALLISVFAVIVCMSTYVFFKVGSINATYSTHQQQYAWTTTAAFLHDAAPAATCMVLLVFAALVMNSVVVHFLNENYDWESARRTTFGGRDVGARLDRNSLLNLGGTVLSPLIPSKKMVYITCLLLVHTLITICVNVLYVLALLNSKVGSDTIIIIQLGLSVFKLSWIYMLCRLARGIQGISKFGRLVTYLSAYLISFLAGPFIATFFSEDTCFHQVFAGQAAVVSSFIIYYYNCNTVCIGIQCSTSCGFNAPLTMTTVVTPTWTYSFQCSSALLLDYVPVFILSYTLSGIVLPLSSLMFSFPLSHFRGSLLLSVPYRYRLLEALTGFSSDALFNETVSDGSRGTLTELVISSLWSYPAARISTSVVGKDAALNSEFDNGVKHSNSEIEQQVFRQAMGPPSEPTPEDSKHFVSVKFADSDQHENAMVAAFRQEFDVSRRMLSTAFDTSHVIAKFLMNWTIMLTFGLASPILAVIVAIDTCSMVLLWRINFRRIVSSLEIPSAPTGGLQLGSGVIRKLELSSQFTFDGIKFCVYLIMMVCSWFWSLFVFDMIGDVYGYRAAGYSALGLVCTVPLALWVDNQCLYMFHHGQFPLLSFRTSEKPSDIQCESSRTI
jgi:hypothetical protein